MGTATTNVSCPGRQWFVQREINWKRLDDIIQIATWNRKTNILERRENTSWEPKWLHKTKKHQQKKKEKAEKNGEVNGGTDSEVWCRLLGHHFIIFNKQHFSGIGRCLAFGNKLQTDNEHSHLHITKKSSGCMSAAVHTYVNTVTALQHMLLSMLNSKSHWKMT